MLKSKAAKPKMTCPICTKDTDPKYKPFCSRRCADVDLGKWLNESYCIPSDEPEDTEGQTTKAADPGDLLH